MLQCSGFFLSSLQGVFEKYPTLFSGGIEDEGDGEPERYRNSSGFNENYGWLCTAKQIADFLNIKLDDVWEISMLESFNYRLYLNAKAQFDEEQIKKIKNK